MESKIKHPGIKNLEENIGAFVKTQGLDSIPDGSCGILDEVGEHYAWLISLEDKINSKDVCGIRINLEGLKKDRKKIKVLLSVNFMKGFEEGVEFDEAGSVIGVDENLTEVDLGVDPVSEFKKLWSENVEYEKAKKSEALITFLKQIHEDIVFAFVNKAPNHSTENFRKYIIARIQNQIDARKRDN